MKFQSITIKDIAKALNVSVSTVSRALRDSYEIGTETKQKVMDYAKKHNYTPNPIALSLQGGKKKSIGIVISQISNSFCSQVINGIESIACNNGYQVSIIQTNELYQREVEAVQYLASRVDGILISIASETKNIAHLKQLHLQGMPIVFFDRAAQEINTHRTISNNYQATYDATEHLIKQGYQNIAFIGGAKSLEIVQERKRGYEDAISKNCLKLNSTFIKYCPLGGVNFNETEKVLDELFSLKEKPDAIISCWDKVTANCFQYLKTHSIKMPEEIGLIGFSNFPLTEYTAPSLSVIQQQAESIGISAAKQLIATIERKRRVINFDTEIFMPNIIIRESSSKCRVK